MTSDPNSAVTEKKKSFLRISTNWPPKARSSPAPTARLPCAALLGPA